MQMECKYINLRDVKFQKVTFEVIEFPRQKISNNIITMSNKHDMGRDMGIDY